MTVIETGMSVRLLVDDVTGGPLKAGDVCQVEGKAPQQFQPTMYWVVRTRKRNGLEDTIDRAPFYSDELEHLHGQN